MSRKKILLGHLNSNGDCLFATVIARQIKEIDYPNSHLTWAVNSKCRQAVEMNPYIDEIWEIPTEKVLTNAAEWESFLAETASKQQRGEFDEVFLTQIIGANEMRYDGGIRSSIYNNYPHEIVVPHQPIIKLSAAEIENVRRFAEENAFDEFSKIVLVECSPQSFTTALNLQTAQQLALQIVTENAQTACVISSKDAFAPAHPQIFDASELSFRENAELTEYCDLLIGCGSGISWLTTTDGAKNLDKILIINNQTTAFASIADDHRFFGLPTDRLIEIKSDADAPRQAAKCFAKINSDGFAAARKQFHEEIRTANFFYLENQLRNSLKSLKIGEFLQILRRYFKRNGAKLFFNPDFLKVFGKIPFGTIRKKSGF